ncbi:hypothetical protein NA57DRAFT_60171 [Rhizodiscina lignyota]|uniref:Zn(2)-C6 fungal-type domain-containing protein n=1 Tax=Rhizodiscina lignyota TaxID=1504668 RepID=A0A9P4M2L0_9PEZI|nr:hypothetical protein NA57DRAFT_60171 [Rhizodiscina lignyota]
MPQNEARVVRKRARTGCARCRLRRRKCGEEKPKCRNCIEKGFECKYSIQLAFHKHKAFTTGPDEAPPAGAVGSYGPIKFVNDTPDKRSRNTRSTSDGSSRTTTTEIDVEEVGIAPEHLLPTSSETQASPTSQQGFRGAQFEDVLDLPESITTGLEHQESPQLIRSPLSPNDNFTRHESAVHGLLALSNPTTDQVDIGHDRPVTSAGSIDAIPEYQHSPVTGRSGSLETLQSLQTFLSARPPNKVHAAIRQESSDNSQVSPSSERTVQLFSHYRYHVAPWLDNCDLTQQYGVRVPLIAKASDPVRFAVMAVAARSLGLSDRAQGTIDFECSRYWSLARDSLERNPLHSDVERLLVRSFEAVFDFTTRSCHSWKELIDGLRQDLAAFPSVAPGSEPINAISWLHLRLGRVASSLIWLPCKFGLLKLTVTCIALAAALLGGATVKTSVASSSSFTRPPAVHSAVSEKLSESANNVLLLCAQVTRLRYGEDHPSGFQGNLRGCTLLDTWRAFWDDLQQWHDTQPHEFLPVIEISAETFQYDSSLPFSTVVFSTGAAIFANQLYHTALLLLLQCKPRTLRLKEQRGAPISQLWHAQRICSIAINNDSGDNWHPTLVVSLLLAAKLMTHASQQQAILQHLKHVRAITGWEIQDIAQILEEEWHPADVT